MKKIVALFLTLTLSLGVATPVFAQTITIKENLVYSENEKPEPRLAIEIITAVFAGYTLSYSGMKEFGTYARNQGWDYNTCRNIVVAASLPFGIVLGPPLVMGFNNGWNA